MARFLDEEEQLEYLDITSTTDEAQAPQAGTVGGGPLPSPPHQPPLEVSTTDWKMARVEFLHLQFALRLTVMASLSVGVDRPDNR